MNNIRLVWVDEGQRKVCYPYNDEGIIKEGIDFEIWLQIVMKGNEDEGGR